MKVRHSILPAAYLALIKDNKILLLRRYNTGYEDGRYSMVAGHVDPEESFTTAIIREAKEEADIELLSQDLLVAHVMHRITEEKEYNERVDVFFIAAKWKGEIANIEPHKCDDLSWFPIDDLPSNTIPYVRQAIEAILVQKPYSEFGW